MDQAGNRAILSQWRVVSRTQSQVPATKIKLSYIDSNMVQDTSVLERSDSYQQYLIKFELVNDSILSNLGGNGSNIFIY